MSEHPFGIETDERVNALMGYCPHCPLHEGKEPFVRLKTVTREFRQCPNCRRTYYVPTDLEPAEATPAAPGGVEPTVLAEIHQPWCPTCGATMCEAHGHPFPTEDDVPLLLRRELMKCASARGISYYWLCAIYRQGRLDTEAANGAPTQPAPPSELIARLRALHEQLGILAATPRALRSFEAQAIAAEVASAVEALELQQQLATVRAALQAIYDGAEPPKNEKGESFQWNYGSRGQEGFTKAIAARALGLPVRDWLPRIALDALAALAAVPEDPSAP